MANKKDGTDDNIHAGHRERVRRRFFADPEMRTFSPHEILEYLLFYGVQRKDTNELAHKLIRAFGSLSAVFDASIDDLLAFPELPERAACLIKSIIPIANAYMKDGKRNAAVIDSYSDILSFYNHSSLSLNPNEERVSAIFLDVGGRVKNFAEVSAGGASNVTVDIPKLYRYASACKASKVVVFHNHPGDTMYPSQGDLIATSVMIITLASLGPMSLMKLLSSSIFLLRPSRGRSCSSGDLMCTLEVVFATRASKLRRTSSRACSFSMVSPT